MRLIFATLCVMAILIGACLIHLPKHSGMVVVGALMLCNLAMLMAMNRK